MPCFKIVYKSHTLFVFGSLGIIPNKTFINSKCTYGESASGALEYKRKSGGRTSLAPFAVKLQRLQNVYQPIGRLRSTISNYTSYYRRNNFEFRYGGKLPQQSHFHGSPQENTWAVGLTRHRI